MYSVLYFLANKKLPFRERIMVVDIRANYSNEFIQWCIDWEKVVLGLIDTFKHNQDNVASSLDLEQTEYTIRNTNCR